MRASRSRAKTTANNSNCREENNSNSSFSFSSDHSNESSDNDNEKSSKKLTRGKKRSIKSNEGPNAKFAKKDESESEESKSKKLKKKVTNGRKTVTSNDPFQRKCQELYAKVANCCEEVIQFLEHFKKVNDAKYDSNKTHDSKYDNIRSARFLRSRYDRCLDACERLSADVAQLRSECADDEKFAIATTTTAAATVADKARIVILEQNDLISLAMAELNNVTPRLIEMETVANEKSMRLAADEGVLELVSKVPSIASIIPSTYVPNLTNSATAPVRREYRYRANNKAGEGVGVHWTWDYFKRREFGSRQSWMVSCRMCEEHFRTDTNIMARHLTSAHSLRNPALNKMAAVLGVDLSRSEGGSAFCSSARNASENNGARQRFSSVLAMEVKSEPLDVDETRPNPKPNTQPNATVTVKEEDDVLSESENYDSYQPLEKVGEDESSLSSTVPAATGTATVIESGEFEVKQQTFSNYTTPHTIMDGHTVANDHTVVDGRLNRLTQPKAKTHRFVRVDDALKTPSSSENSNIVSVSVQRAEDSELQDFIKKQLQHEIDTSLMRAIVTGDVSMSVLENTDFVAWTRRLMLSYGIPLCEEIFCDVLLREEFARAKKFVADAVARAQFLTLFIDNHSDDAHSQILDIYLRTDNGHLCFYKTIAVAENENVEKIGSTEAVGHSSTDEIAAATANVIFADAALRTEAKKKKEFTADRNPSDDAAVEDTITVKEEEEDQEEMKVSLEKSTSKNENNNSQNHLSVSNESTTAAVTQPQLADTATQSLQSSVFHAAALIARLIVTAIEAVGPGRVSGVIFRAHSQVAELARNSLVERYSWVTVAFSARGIIFSALRQIGELEFVRECLQNCVTITHFFSGMPATVLADAQTHFYGHSSRHKTFSKLNLNYGVEDSMEYWNIVYTFIATVIELKNCLREAIMDGRIRLIQEVWNNGGETVFNAVYGSTQLWTVLYLLEPVIGKLLQSLVRLDELKIVDDTIYGNSLWMILESGLSCPDVILNQQRYASAAQRSTQITVVKILSEMRTHVDELQYVEKLSQALKPTLCGVALATDGSKIRRVAQKIIENSHAFGPNDDQMLSIQISNWELGSGIFSARQLARTRNALEEGANGGALNAWWRRHFGALIIARVFAAVHILPLAALDAFAFRQSVNARVSDDMEMNMMINFIRKNFLVNGAQRRDKNVCDDLIKSTPAPQTQVFASPPPAKRNNRCNSESINSCDSSGNTCNSEYGEHQMESENLSQSFKEPKTENDNDNYQSQKTASCVGAATAVLSDSCENDVKVELDDNDLLNESAQIK